MLHTDSRFLLGTNIDIAVVSMDSDTPRKIAMVFEYFSSFEQEFSRFLPDSALSRLNRKKTLEVSSRFLELMELSKIEYQKTDGFFNPLVQVSRLGYSHSFDTGVFEENDAAVDTDFSKISISGNRVSLAEHQELDFGGIGKGYAVDKAGEMLRIFGYDDFFVNAGGDIVAHGKNASGKPWVIGVENPFTGTVNASFSLSDQAVATSGRYRRTWELHGTKRHHLVDPHTGENDDRIMSVTIIAPRCVDADTFTKKVFHLKEEEGLQAIESNGMEGLIVTKEGKTYFTKGLKEKYGFQEKESQKI